MYVNYFTLIPFLVNGAPYIGKGYFYTTAHPMDNRVSMEHRMSDCEWIVPGTVDPLED